MGVDPPDDPGGPGPGPGPPVGCNVVIDDSSMDTEDGIIPLSERKRSKPTKKHSKSKKTKAGKLSSLTNENSNEQTMLPPKIHVSPVNTSAATQPTGSEDERVKTFKYWPYNDNNKCNIRNMAEAGFYSVATGDTDVDAVKCFLCGKELDGWEPEDDPWAEHKSHAAYCAFVQLNKREDDLLLPEYLSIILQYMKNEIRNNQEIATQLIDKKAKEVWRKIHKLRK
ncbi:unnamed protein product [Leptidea sinapis]|uniref:Inhibitor of Apoptosis domain-containing protein n=1 Tax=Leptidea sinapis TaxID=189913 RepID=A0A5E4QYD1_9NEOP|nr:unnamed protein product [Leptidea sinapis]